MVTKTKDEIDFIRSMARRELEGGNSLLGENRLDVYTYKSVEAMFGQSLFDLFARQGKFVPADDDPKGHQRPSIRVESGSTILEARLTENGSGFLYGNDLRMPYLGFRVSQRANTRRERDIIDAKLFLSGDRYKVLIADLYIDPKIWGKGTTISLYNDTTGIKSWDRYAARMSAGLYRWRNELPNFLMDVNTRDVIKADYHQLAYMFTTECSTVPMSDEQVIDARRTQWWKKAGEVLVAPASDASSNVGEQSYVVCNFHGGKIGSPNELSRGCPNCNAPMNEGNYRIETVRT